MNAPLRRVGVVVMVLFGLLFANLNWVQALQGRRIPHQRLQRPGPGRRVRAPARQHRGRRHGAGRRARRPSGKLKFLRTYPVGAEYAHVLGYKPVNLADDRHRAARERLPRRHQRPAVRRPGQGHVHRRADRRRQRAADPLASAPRTTAYNAAAQQQGRARSRARRSPSTRGPARSRRWSRCPASTRTRWPATTPTRRSAAYNKLEQDPDKPLQNRALAETLPARLDLQEWSAAAALENGDRPEHPDPGRARATSRRRPPARRSATPPTSICPEAQVTPDARRSPSRATPASPSSASRLGADKVKEKARAVRLRARRPHRRPARRGRRCRVAASRTGAMTERRTAATTRRRSPSRRSASATSG